MELPPEGIRNQGQIFIGSIARYNPDTGQYYCKYQGMSGDPNKGFAAQLMSPLPFTDGGGIKSIPKVPIDTPCVIYRANNMWYILGFLTPNGAVVNDGPYQTRPIGEGETFMTHHTGTKMGFTKNGSMIMWASIWMNAILNPIKQQFTAFFKNMIINWTAGHVEYRYDKDKKTSKLTLGIQKDVDFSPITPGAVSPDRVVTKLGYLEDTHLVQVDLKQNFDASNTPQFAASAKIGKQQDNTWLDIQSVDSPASPVTFNLKSATTGKTQITSQSQDSSTSVNLTLDPAQSEVVRLVVNNDKAIITIDAQGNVIIKQTDGANLYLGGKDKAQRLVTEKFLDLVFWTHMHPTAAVGAPSPPIKIAAPVTSDSPSNITSFTTFAE
jgi:hypothetical protein